jgi:hypothetical protein
LPLALVKKDILCPLLYREANVEARLAEALCTAARSGYRDLVEILLDRGPPVNKGMEFLAVLAVAGQQRTSRSLTPACLKSLLRLCGDCSWVRRTTPRPTGFDPLPLMLCWMEWTSVGVPLLLSLQSNTHNKCATPSRSSRPASLEDDGKEYYLSVAPRCPRPDAPHTAFVLEAVH